MSDNRIARVRRALEEQSLDALLLLQSEATPSQNLRYLTGFTGSAGWLLVTRTEQLVGTDSRYWEQCAKQAP
ncbi:MAG: aminopeptidase P family N-terminal domain-containing protein, partial [Chloroflexi bacterium]|nr:aminopeptidase P family N-terminal domain-containing protein [Chloroflexota bacterium]